jgi:hypothetical protein
MPVDQQDPNANKAPEMATLKSNPESKYKDAQVTRRQQFEGWILSVAMLIAVALTFFLWHYYPDAFWAYAVLAGVAGIIGGLMHSLKWFYRTISSGEWEWDKVWWRFMNPLVSGVMGLSIYIVFRSGIEAKQAAGTAISGREGLYAYSIGFLTGLFADNAMGKLRDIAYVLFGPTAPAASKPKSSTSGAHNHGKPTNE